MLIQLDNTLLLLTNQLSAEKKLPNVKKVIFK